jgi:hypothetical protein
MKIETNKIINANVRLNERRRSSKKTGIGITITASITTTAKPTIYSCGLCKNALNIETCDSIYLLPHSKF